MLDWNWQVLKTTAVFALIAAAMAWFAWETATVPHAVAGGMAALLLQTGLYAFGTSRQVRQTFDLSQPLHRIVRWDNTWFRTIKTVLEMAGLAAMVWFAFKFLVHYQIASFLAFALLLTGAPVPLFVWAYYRKVLSQSRRAMQARRTAATPPLPGAPALPALKGPVAAAPTPRLARSANRAPPPMVVDDDDSVF